jgi:hypothetical protein
VSTCSDTATSATCDGNTINCPSGSCSPPQSCPGGTPEEFCQCLYAGGGGVQARIHCSESVCFP